MTLAELKALTQPGSYLEKLIPELEAGTPLPATKARFDKATQAEREALGRFVYNLFGLDLLVKSWKIQNDSEYNALFTYLPLTQADKEYLIAHEADTAGLDILRSVYPNGSLPADVFNKFSLCFRSDCLFFYPLSEDIVLSEYKKVDELYRTDDFVYGLHDWLEGLAEALAENGYHSESEQMWERVEELEEHGYYV